MTKHTNNIKKITYGPLALSFWLPFFFLLTYFIYRHMAPFGSQTILTVDLGQQYLDYFAQFKETILHDPSAFFYSFSSGLGGDMIGEWSYYLMSPFNLFFLFANATTLPAWILLVTLFKISSAGLTMAFYLKKVAKLTGYEITLFAINYPLSAWFIANALNLLWLDTAVLLPLLLWSLHRLITQKKAGAFTLLLMATILSNYYVAWMIGLFLLLYLPIALAQEKRFKQAFSSRRFFCQLFFSGLTAILATAWLWLPTIAQLKLGKTTHNPNWTFGFENNPADLFFKLIPGSFDFDQMQTGMANFLVAPIVFFFLWPFFTSKSIRMAEKIASGAALTILFLATTWTPLVLLFHGGQYPVWYPVRFSFLISFLLIFLAARGYQQSEVKNAWLPSIPARLLYLLSPVSITITGSLMIGKLSYINKTELLVFLFAYLLILLVLLFARKNTRFWTLFALTALFLAANLALTLNHLAYLTNQEYQSGASQLVKVNQALKKDSSWYRVEEGLGRTYNDGFLGQFKAGSHFSSLLPAQSSSFYQNMGQISGDSKLSYNNGTTVLDSLLSFKYYLTDNATARQKTDNSLIKSSRFDYDQKKTFASGRGWALKENDQALSVAYAASKEALKTPINNRYPLANQERLLTYLAGKPDQILLTQQPIKMTGSYNLKPMSRLTGGVMRPINKKKAMSLVLSFTPTTDGAYYLNLGGALDLSAVTLKLNDQKLTQETGYNHTVALNVANDQLGKVQTLSISVSPGVESRYLDDFSLYAFDQKAVAEDLSLLNKHELHIEKSNARRIEGRIQTTKSQSLIMTSIPTAPGWTAKVDGKTAKIKTVAGGLIAVPTKPGQHQLVLTYTPPLFWPGVALLLLTLSSYFGFLIYKRKFSLAPKKRP
ncbi:YfhO family protein [Fructobacillus sp. M1-13]|uniref:YfhO family protein n=1 Tax=Fructobacillus papyriferae TaxID=2713171 RepID=A0ABS5QPH9_9LACO|nr:YfhO family protein [Fructobacillus papyriferae]MBS9335088.1 YfhO family protein [Fructobacillus papyriferae]MCD2159426.1 YfhO family protein [Fructobacillus papyriferae]